MHTALILLMSNVLNKIVIVHWNHTLETSQLHILYFWQILLRLRKGCSCLACEASCVTVVCSTVYPEWGGEWKARLKAFAVQLISVNPSNCMHTSMFLLSMQAIVYDNEAKHTVCVSVRIVKDAHRLLNRGRKTLLKKKYGKKPNQTKSSCLYKHSYFLKKVLKWNFDTSTERGWKTSCVKMLWKALSSTDLRKV